MDLKIPFCLDGGERNPMGIVAVGTTIVIVILKQPNIIIGALSSITSER
jgi:hypothetical protein